MIHIIHIRKNLGTVLITALPLLNVALWLVFPPIDDGSRLDYDRQYIGEIIASSMMLLMAFAFLLSTRLRFLESLFHGLDKMYAAHRHSGVAAFLLLILHFLVMLFIPDRITPGRVPGFIAFGGFVILILLTLAPRLPVVRKLIRIRYRGWRISHKFIGVFFIMGAAHTLLVDPLVRSTIVPFIVLMAAIVVGIVSYLYTELFARFVRRTAAYDVQEVNHLNKKAVEVVLKQAKKKQLNFKAGQFLFVRFKGNRVLSEPHPFTISSSPSETNIRLTISAAGDYTQYLYKHLKAGTRAIVEGGYGMMDYRQGGKEQIWIAGGIGVTPFISWIRDMPQERNQRIDFYYTVRTPEDALYLDEILEAAQGQKQFHAHIHYSADQGRLAIETILAASGSRVADKHVYMCGPTLMITGFQRQFRRLGVPSSSIHYEEFAFR
ncbi:ferredoxin reductase family protein [Paenibacillus sp. MMS18-CY102]|uniref:ferredoxin reductase family protein n=1 Tax=Paenibacillus sp. MMS18-CY102 TaxID=2682849 RepID=UPI0013666DCD|nr:ferric reductase-like transmembrane domain-containing protein [Paenibacillus sp. MMS18-CY102]MWC30215.1 hypothetical protein [Paenibacillus sp. MMS18-CY102]